MNRALRLAALAAVVAGLAASPASAAQYRETFDPGKSPAEVMDGLLDVGPSGPWTGELADGAYILTNRTEPGAVRYYHIDSVPGAPSGALRDATVSVEVSGDFASDPSGAGLIYRFDPATRTYWAFALTSDGYGVFKRDLGGFRRVMAGSGDAVRPGAANRLTVRSAPDGTAQFLINDQVVGGASSSDITGSGVGIVALGAGSFRFDDFTVSTDDGAALDRSGGAGRAGAGPAALRLPELARLP